MTSELLVYAEIGFRHITDPRGADHVLFLLALAAIYRPRDWRDALWVVTAFTVGHSITLVLAVTGAVTLPATLIEFLIPVTILATAVENVLARGKRRIAWRTLYRPIAAGVFGLVHGAGFANYLRSLFVESMAVPLLGFNLGLEAGQVVVLVGALAAFGVVDAGIGRARGSGHVPDAAAPFRTLRLRAVSVSALVAVVAARWAAERFPW